MKKKILIPIISLFLCSCSFTFPSSTSEKSIENSELSSNTISQNSNNCNTSNNLTNSETNSSFESIYSSNEEKDIAPLYIHFLELGNRFVGDCVYIKAGETDILIDAGSRTTSSYTLTNYINKYCLDKKLEYVIATHCHEDHISGFIGSSSNPGIFETYKCDTIIDFPLTHKEEKSALGNKTQYGRYKELLDKEVSEGAKHFNALQCYNNENEAKRTYEVANGITLTFLYNYYYENETKSNDENNYSVCVLLTQGDNNFLFTGDLEKEGEEKLVEYNSLPHVKVFKGGHHGSSNANSEVLLNTITPENICICTCAGTSEYTDEKNNQFPYQETINRMAKYTENIYVTTQVDHYVDNSSWKKNDAGGSVKSMNGDIVVTSTKDNFTIIGSNNSLILKDTEWFKNNRTWPSQT